MSFAEPALDTAEERERDDKRSIIASGAALGILVFALILLPSNWISSAFEAFLYGAGLCMVIWLTAHFTILRRGSDWMTLIAFVTLLVVAVAGTTFKYLRYSAGANYDSNRARHRLIDTLYAMPGTETVVSDVGDPAMSISGRYLNNILKDRTAYSKAMEKTDMQKLIEYPQLMRGHDTLKNCDSLLEVSAIAKQVKPNAHNHAKAARTEISTSDLNRASRQALLAEFEALQKIFLPMQDRLWEARSELATHMQTSCRILARGRWQNQGQVTFTDKGDFDAFEANAKKVNRLLDEEVEIQNAALRKSVDILNAM
jgi:hypothetical protein